MTHTVDPNERFTVEVDNRVVKACRDAKEAFHFFRIEMRFRAGSGEKIGIFDNRDNRWERPAEAA